MTDIRCIIIGADSEHMPAAMELRKKVFIDEQSVPHNLEVDGRDNDAMHVVALSEGLIVGTLRMLPEGLSLHIGRVAVLQELRRRRIGTKMMETAMQFAQDKQYTSICLDAQTTAIPFYTRLGFRTTGEVFMDAGMPHVSMEKPLISFSSATSHDR